MKLKNPDPNNLEFLYLHKSVEMSSRTDFRFARVVPAPEGYARKTPNKKSSKRRKHASFFVVSRTGTHGYVIILRGERRK